MSLIIHWNVSRRNSFKHCIAWKCSQFRLHTSASQPSAIQICVNNAVFEQGSFSAPSSSTRYRVWALAIKLAVGSQSEIRLCQNTSKPKLRSTTTMKTLKGFNNIAAIVESARRRSLAKEEKENKKRDSFCKGEGSRRGSLVKSGSRRESLILGFESVAILQGKRRKSLKLVAGPTFSNSKPIKRFLTRATSVSV